MWHGCSCPDGIEEEKETRKATSANRWEIVNDPVSERSTGKYKLQIAQEYVLYYEST